MQADVRHGINRFCHGMAQVILSIIKVTEEMMKK